jgi:large subunit ribosomal protein L9
MEVILREDVPHLGNIGDLVKVKPGFARNYLLPRGLAVVADKRNVGALEHERRVVAQKRERALSAAQTQVKKLSELRLKLKARAGEEGKLFGSVTNLDVERALAAEGFSIDRRRIRLDEPIKQLGEYRVAIQLGVGVAGEVLVVVESIEEQPES